MWYCATSLHKENSFVIPGHSYWVKDNLRPITLTMVTPPAWCERVLEQTILSPEEKVELQQDSNVVYDGNDLAEWRAKSRKDNPLAIRNYGPVIHL